MTHPSITSGWVSVARNVSPGWLRADESVSPMRTGSNVPAASVTVCGTRTSTLGAGSDTFCTGTFSARTAAAEARPWASVAPVPPVAVALLAAAQSLRSLLLAYASPEVASVTAFPELAFVHGAGGSVTRAGGAAAICGIAGGAGIAAGAGTGLGGAGLGNSILATSTGLAKSRGLATSTGLTEKYTIPEASTAPVAKGRHQFPIHAHAPSSALITLNATGVHLRFGPRTVKIA